MAADLFAVAVAVRDLYQRLDCCVDRPGMDRRPHRLPGRLRTGRVKARYRLRHPGAGRRRAVVRRAGGDRVANGARLTPSSWRKPGPIPRNPSIETRWRTPRFTTSAWGNGSWLSPGRQIAISS